MDSKLNSFQVYLLTQLNVTFPDAASIRLYKSAWLTNNLTCTEEDADRWISLLLKEMYIKDREQQAPILYNFFKELDSHNAHNEYAITQKGRDYLAFLTKLENKEDAQSVNATLAGKEVVESPSRQAEVVPTDIEQLIFLRKKLQGKRIMNDEDYKRLTGYTNYLLEHNAIPKTIQKIPRLVISAECIVGAYFEIWSLHRKTVDRTKIGPFLRKVFEQFDTRSESTIYGRLSQYKNNYEQIKTLVE